MSQTCPVCEFMNTAYATVCTQCGSALEDYEATRPIEIPRQTTRGRTHFIQTVVFNIGDDQLSISLKPDERLILGRQSSHMPDDPDLDLGRFKAAEHGISRIHAVLECHEAGIYLMDLGSRNGTCANGEALAAFQPHLLQDGDVVSLGKLTVSVNVRVEEGDNRFAVSARPRSKTGKLEEALRLQRV
ncbi:MAG: FHA domain-containing protein [Anaerolineae bacterium]|nr:FHA domain-containing protein [Anaerolineae bacterium]